MMEQDNCKYEKVDTEFGILHKVPFNDYVILTNYCPKTEKKIQLTKDKFSALNCLHCGHPMIHFDGKLMHLGIFKDIISISDKCHSFAEGQENSYSTWYQRCGCKNPSEKLQSKEITVEMKKQ
jgi:hypothetical protein